MKITKRIIGLMIFIQLFISIVLIPICINLFKGAISVYKWRVIQIIWLSDLLGNLGFPMVESGGMFGLPSWLGWIAIIIGTFISLVLEYWLATLLNRYILKRKI